MLYSKQKNTENYLLLIINERIQQILNAGPLIILSVIKNLQE